MNTLNHASSRVVKANGHRVHYLESGNGPLVLLVHGFPELSYSWRYQMPVLAEAGYHAVAIDQLGYGRSSKPTHVEAYRMTELVKTLVEVVEATGHTTAVMVGHDWGAPMVWSATWMRPDVFEAVVAISVPFGGRGQMAFPGSVLGELEPREIERKMAGPDLMFYQEYFRQAEIPEREMEEDVRSWLRDVYFSFSGDAPLPPDAPQIDTKTTDLEIVMPRLRNSGLCMKPGTRFRDRCITPETLPSWLSDEDLDYYVAEFERTGFTGALNNYYRSLDLNWEVLGPYEGRKVEVPALFVTAERDGTMLWCREGINRMKEVVPQLRETVIFKDCGHWIQQERAADFNRLLLDFLVDVKGERNDGT
jgi:pimeloyl-ACP methyl ester carboxylesterase